jgi:hypothetical protein
MKDAELDGILQVLQSWELRSYTMLGALTALGNGLYALWKLFWHFQLWVSKKLKKRMQPRSRVPIAVYFILIPEVVGNAFRFLFQFSFAFFESRLLSARWKRVAITIPIALSIFTTGSVAVLLSQVRGLYCNPLLFCGQ